MSNRRIAGVAYLKVNGTQYPLRGNFTVMPSKNERTGIAGQDAVHGFKEIPVVPYVEGDLSTTAGLSIEALDAITDASVTAELANGKTYLLRNAWTAGTRSIDTTEGVVGIRFEGLSCEEIA